MEKKEAKAILKGGIRKDPEDSRDYIFTAPVLPGNVVITSESDMPKKVDHTAEMTPVKYQNNLGSCIAFSVNAMKEWQEQKEHDKEVKEGKVDHRKNIEHYNLSEQWLYYNCKKIDPWPGQSGTNFRSAFKVLSKIGVPTEEGWPYNPVEVGKPESWATMIAKWYLCGSYWRISGLENIKKALVEGPIVIGMVLFQEIFGKLVDGVVPYPAKPDEVWGNHAVTVVGFSDSTQMLKIRNSWSLFWGQAGYGYIPYSYVNDFVFDAWIARDISVTNEMLKGTRKLIE